MDITVVYTDEEKRLFDEVHSLKEKVHLLENETYLLRKEYEEHTLENHTQGVPPIVYLAGAILSITLVICDLIIGFEFEMFHFAAAIAVASVAPAIAIFCGIMFAISYRKYYYQVVQTKAGRKKAEELHIKNYYSEQERIMDAYRKAKDELDVLKELYRRKSEVLDELVERKTAENDRAREEAIRKRTEILGEKSGKSKKADEPGDEKDREETERKAL